MSRKLDRGPVVVLDALNEVSEVVGAPGDNTRQFYDEILVRVTGTFTGTLTFQASVDNAVTFVPFGGAAAATPGTQTVSTATAAGMWIIKSPPPQFRVQMTAFTSGAANVQIVKVRNR